ncbi:MAG: serine/threonine-protein kinase, partial [Actinomycetota bacterium]
MSETTIPGFELERTLGAGGFGTVWLARQPSVDRLVAVKIGHRRLEDAAARTRFQRECQALGRLTGRSDIVDVHVAGSLPDGRPYLVLEYVEGGTLWDRVERGPLEESELVSIGQQLCTALDHAHRADILHRDIKPENVFLRPDGSIVLGDFGIAAAHNSDATRSAGLTATIPYTAPEVLGGERATVASDLYAVGATVLAAATRTVPFVDEADAGLPALLNRVLEGKLPDIRTQGYGDGLAAVVERLLSPDP